MEANYGAQAFRNGRLPRREVYGVASIPIGLCHARLQEFKKIISQMLKAKGSIDWEAIKTMFPEESVWDLKKRVAAWQRRGFI